MNPSVAGIPFPTLPITFSETAAECGAWFWYLPSIFPSEDKLRLISEPSSLYQIPDKSATDYKESRFNYCHRTFEYFW